VDRRDLDVEVPEVSLDGPPVPIRAAGQLGAAAMAEGMQMELRRPAGFTERLDGFQTRNEVIRSSRRCPPRDRYRTMKNGSLPLAPCRSCLTYSVRILLATSGKGIGVSWPPLPRMRRRPKSGA
jgi:hypothetical protein